MEKGYPGKVAVALEKFNIQKMIAGKSIPYLDIERTELNGSIEGEGLLSDLGAVPFRGKMDGAMFEINKYELKNSGEIEFTILNGALTFDKAGIVGEGTDLSLEGTLPLDSGTLDMTLNGALNLAVLSRIEEKVTTGGNADIDISATGPIQNPRIMGRLSLNGAVVSYEGLPFPLSNLHGDMLFSENVVRLENISGEAASGKFDLSGAYEHNKMEMQAINMKAVVRDMRLEYPKDFNSIVSANLALSGDGDAQVLSGEVDVKRSEYIRNFNLLERFTEQGAPEPGGLAASPALQNLRLNVEFRSNNGLIIDNELARVQASLRLTLRGTPAYPSLTGRVEASDGTIFFRRNRFEISHAYADFVDRSRINPILEIRAEADVKTYRLILDATGALDNLSINIRSDPPMSTVDIISLLTTGLADSGTQTSERETQLAGMSAASVLSENLTGVLGKRVERILGLESFRVDPFLAGTDNDPTARITVSERISRDLVLTFSRNLSTNEEQVVVIEYDVGKGLSITATRDEDGEFGVDFRLRKRF
jgi:translocation and assembly module TamB